MDAQRDAVLAEAQSWLKTPWRHMADVKGAGVDCVMLVVRSFVDAGVVPPLDPRPYPAQWFLHRDEERLITRLLGAGAYEIPASMAKPADVILYRFGRCFAHAGIILNAEDIIHSYARFNSVVVTPRRYGELANKPMKFFTIW